MTRPVPASDPCRWDAAMLAAAYRERQVTPREVVRAHLDRIAAIDATTCAYVALRAEGALADARVAEDRWSRGAPLGPLDGVPAAIKDLMAVEGLPMTGGSSRPWAPAPADAEPVRRLREVGAVVLGTNTLHEYAFGGTSVNAHVGTPRNPRDPSRIAGGSSGGTAAAVAAGLATVGLGTETGNSVRRPAAFCGVVGFKPTYGRLSRRGVLPLAPSLDHVGAFGRTVADVAATVDAIAGHDPGDPGSRKAPGPASGIRDVRGLRVGVPRSLADAIEPAIGTAFEAALERLAEAGALVVDIDLPLASRWTAIASSLVMHGEAAIIHAGRFAADPGSYGGDVAARVLSGLALSPEDLVRAGWLRAQIEAELEGVLGAGGHADVLVAPTVPATAPALAPGAFVPGDAPWSTEVGPFHLQRLPSLVGMPAGTAPVGWTAGGMPLPMMAMGARWRDADVLGVIHAVCATVHVADPGPA